MTTDLLLKTASYIYNESNNSIHNNLDLDNDTLFEVCEEYLKNAYLTNTRINESMTYGQFQDALFSIIEDYEEGNTNQSAFSKKVNKSLDRFAKQDPHYKNYTGQPSYRGKNRVIAGLENKYLNPRYMARKVLRSPHAIKNGISKGVKKVSKYL